MKAQLTEWFSDTPAITSLPERPIVSTANAPHYTWASICDGWRLASAPTLSVIQERMPPGTAEERHRHSRVRQFFFVLGGVLTLEVEGTAHRLGPRQGLEVAPGQVHQARNEGEGDAEFLVISDGVSREDRQETT